jgi:hypothetical protein
MSEKTIAQALQNNSVHALHNKVAALEARHNHYKAKSI